MTVRVRIEIQADADAATFDNEPAIAMRGMNQPKHTLACFERAVSDARAWLAQRLPEQEP